MNKAAGSLSLLHLAKRKVGFNHWVLPPKYTKSLSTSPQPNHSLPPGSASNPNPESSTPNNESAPESVAFYVISAGLILGSMYYAQHMAKQPIIPLEPGTTKFSILSSGKQQEQHDHSSNLFQVPDESESSTFKVWWARLQNLWIYPSAIRAPLRTALIYHHVFPDPQKAESSYLVAWQNSKDTLDLQVGIQFELAQFYADQSLPIPCLHWYQNGLENLIAWHKQQQKNKDGRGVADHVILVRAGTVLAHMARALAYLDSNPDSGSIKTHVPDSLPLQIQSVDRYYSMALGSMLLADRIKHMPSDNTRPLVDQFFSGILVNQIPALPSTPEPTKPAVYSSKSPPLVSLLEEMAAYYTTQSRYAYSATLRRTLIPYMTPIQKNSRDIYCHTGTVYNNLANDLTMIAESSPEDQRLLLLNEAVHLLTQAKESTNVKSTDECAECLAVAFANLGHVAFLQGKPAAAVKHLKDSISIARKVGLVDVRRDAQALLTTVKRHINPE